MVIDYTRAEIDDLLKVCATNRQRQKIKALMRSRMSNLTYDKMVIKAVYYPYLRISVERPQFEAWRQFLSGHLVMEAKGKLDLYQQPPTKAYDQFFASIGAVGYKVGFEALAHWARDHLIDCHYPGTVDALPTELQVHRFIAETIRRTVCPMPSRIPTAAGLEALALWLRVLPPELHAFAFNTTAYVTQSIRSWPTVEVSQVAL